MVTANAERRFSNATSAVTAARHYVADILRTWGIATFSAELAVSELATNAVSHASTGFTVRLQIDDATVRVEVADHHPALPAFDTSELASEHGRGLLLVDAVTVRWGIEPRRGGKAIWFIVPVSPDDDPQSS